MPGCSEYFTDPKEDPPSTELAHDWCRCFGDVTPKDVNDVVCDNSRNVIVTSEMEGSANFGGGTLSNADSGNVFLER